MSSDVLDFWLGFLDGVCDMCMQEPFIYLFGIYVGFLMLTYLCRLMKINR